MCGTIARQVRYGATRLTSTTRRHTSGVSSRSGALPPVMPALLTRMSILPRSRRSAATARAIAAASVTSTTAACTRPLPSASRCKAAPALSSAAASTSHSTTVAPDASMRLAMAKPMPRAPPVTIAARFFRSMAFMVPSAHSRESGNPEDLCAGSPLPRGRATTTCSSSLKLHPVRAFEPEQLPRLVRRRDVVTEVLDDAANLGDLLGVALGELARTDIERILQTHPHIAADHRRGGAEIHLMAAAGQHRPQIIVAEQPVGGALHEEQIVEIGTDAAEYAEDQL